MKHLLLILLSAPTAIFCQQDYNVTLIPDSLKQNANAVLRYDETVVTIANIGKATVKHKYAITILNETSDDYGVYKNNYGKLVSLSDISARLYDANGQKIKTAKNKEIYDRSDDDGSFLTDQRAKLFSFNHKTYPYTVEFEDEESFNGIYYLPRWLPVLSDKFAVQQSIFKVETPLDYNLRYKQFCYPNQPTIATSKTLLYRWELKNYKAVIPEPFMPAWNEVTPSVLLAPTKFSIEGFEGNMSTWDGLGKFQNLLNNNKNILPESIKQKIHELTDNIKTDEEKVKILYNYLQHNTRYISIQLGIGGWQPLPASFVAEKKYGDCKALSNFMVSLLKEINIKANYVIILAGDDIKTGLYEDFPCKYSNHIITCVPLQKDTMWLECTDQAKSAGYMGTFTGNRKALAITENGGVVVSTPKFIADENKQIRKVIATIDNNGNLTAKSNSILSGTKQEFVHALLYDATEEQRKFYLNRMINLPTYSVDKNEFKEVKGKTPIMLETIDITAPSYSSISGKRMFVVPNLFNKESKLDTDEQRKFDIVYRRAYKEIDSIEIKIPAGFTVEMMPKSIDIKNKFGRYKMDFSFNADIVKTIRYYEQDTNKFPASDYVDLAKFYEEMYKADRAKMVLVKKD